MANLVCKWVSTDQQSPARQNLVLDEAGIEDPVVFEEDPGTCSRLHSLQRPKFRELLTYARPVDTVHISEMFRLVRGTGHVRRLHLPQRAAEPGPHLLQVSDIPADCAVRQSRRGPRQHEPRQHVGLELLQFLRRGRRPDIA
ncbi:MULTISPECIES: recombinase family protein [unclassified Streptomyces]|uniref:recombinase family protein n=1 Tax=unclassified Streptomyces TaxID=2593676 RepID=UPI00371B48A5